MFAESIQGVGGVVQFPKNYIKCAQAMIKARGGVMIMDEVQTGFGRTGNNYWGFQAHDIIPDIVTMAKGIGNGFPLAAVVTRSDIAASITGWVEKFRLKPIYKRSHQALRSSIPSVEIPLPVKSARPF